MNKQELIFQIQRVEENIENIKQWIKMYYSVYRVEPQTALDSKEVELNKHLESYYYYRKQKDALFKEYELAITNE